MKTSDAGRKFIEGFEALFLQAYDDATERIVKPRERVHGVLTIGYGHTSAAGRPRVYIGMTITKEEADAFLSSDLAAVELEVNHRVKVELSQQQYDALVSFEFNTGWLAHPNCSLLKALNAGNYALADDDFALYDEASGKVERGLVRRRAAEAKIFSEGVYET